MTGYLPVINLLSEGVDHILKKTVWITTKLFFDVAVYRLSDVISHVVRDLIISEAIKDSFFKKIAEVKVLKTEISQPRFLVVPSVVRHNLPPLATLIFETSNDCE